MARLRVMVLALMISLAVGVVPAGVLARGIILLGW
jgi:hypothetical protein